MSQPPPVARRAQTAGILRDLLSFDGRLRRRGWWLSWMGFLVFTASVVFVGSPLIHYFEGAVVGTVAAGVQRSAPLVLACEVLLVWPVAAVFVRRGHDREYTTIRSSAVLSALVGLSLLGTLAPQLITAPRLVVHIFLLLYVIVDYGCLEGTRGANTYGPDPRLPAVAPA